LGYAYGSSTEDTKGVVVKAAPGTHREHVIRTDEIWQEGTAKITLLDKEIFIPFKFRTGFKIEVEDSRPLGCPLGNGPVPSNTPYLLVTNTSVPLPTARMNTLTPSPASATQGPGSREEDQPSSSSSEEAPPSSVPPTVVPPTISPIPPTWTLVPPTLTPIPPTWTSVPSTLTPVPPTWTAVPPTLAPSLNFQWDVNAICNAQHDFVQVRMRNDGSVDVEIAGTIKAQPDGGNEITIAAIPGGIEVCSVGSWCGPIANLRGNLSPSGSGRVWGSTSVYYQGVEVASNSIDTYITCTD
jgi:hypothetical protein